MLADIYGFGTSSRGLTEPEYQTKFPQKLGLLWSISELDGGSEWSSTCGLLKFIKGSKNLKASLQM